MKLLSLILLLLAPLLSCCTQNDSLPLDCSDIQLHNENATSGVYTIYPLGSTAGVTVQVRCETSDGGNWTVIQRRMDGSVNFYRPWDQYKEGFGDPAGEYWLGLEHIHQLTRNRRYELLVDMEDFEGGNASARYSSFSLDSEDNLYALRVSGFTSGDAGDGLKYHNRQKFATFDQKYVGSRCARRYLGAFWYNVWEIGCCKANPNGLYCWGEDGTIYSAGVSWSPWKSYKYSLKTISMKIRPVQ